MRQIAEEPASERIVAHVLNDRAAIGIGVGLPKFVRRRGRETLQKEWLDAIPPCGVDDRFMRQDRVPGGARNHT